MRNDSNATPSIGDSISAWLSTTHEPYENEVRFTGNNKFMGDLPTQAGDFSYIFKGSVDVQAQDKRVFSNSGTGRSIGYDSSEVSYVEADDGTRYTFPEITNVGDEKVFIIVREGNTLRAYNGYTPTATTHDVTGKTFTYDRIGSNTLSINGYKKEDTVYDYAVTDEQAKWWSYLRSASGNILTPPLLPSVTYDVNSAVFDSTGKAVEISNSTDFDFGSNEFAIEFMFNWGGSETNCFIMGKESSSSDRSWYVQLNTGLLRFGYSTNGNSFNQLSASNISWSTNTWYHVVIQRVSNILEFWVNGVLVDNDGLNATIFNSAGNVEIGRRTNYPTQFTFMGYTSIARIYNAPISDIEYNYNAGTVKCFDLLKSADKNNCVMSLPMYNHAGFTGQEVLDETGEGNDGTIIGSLAFSDQGLTVEC